MTILVGTDTLCWHLRLETGRVTIEEVLADSAALGADGVAVNLHHVRGRDRSRGAGGAGPRLGLRLGASGDFLGAARRGDTVAAGVDRVRRWLEGAVALGSDYLRVASGFYRAELAGQPDVIERERELVTAVLGRDGRRCPRGRRHAAAREPLGLHDRGVPADRRGRRPRPDGRVPRRDQPDRRLRQPDRRDPGACAAGARRATWRTTCWSRSSSRTATTGGDSRSSTATPARARPTAAAPRGAGRRPRPESPVPAHDRGPRQPGRGRRPGGADRAGTGLRAIADGARLTCARRVCTASAISGSRPFPTRSPVRASCSCGSRRAGSAPPTCASSRSAPRTGTRSTPGTSGSEGRGHGRRCRRLECR